MQSEILLNRIALAILIVSGVLILDAKHHSAWAQTAPRPAAPGTQKPAPVRTANRPPPPPTLADAPGTRRDAAGRVTETKSALGRATRYEYVGQTETLKAIVHPDGTRQEFEYDARGRLLVERAGGIVVSTYTYLPDGKVASAREAGQPELRFTYTPDGRVKSRANALGQTTGFEYDARGNLTREIDPLRGVTLRTYDATNQLTSVTSPSGGVMRYQYDGGGRLTQQTDEIGGVTRYEHSDNGLLLAEVDATGQRTQYDYDTAGQLTRITNPGRTVETFKYDNFGQLIETTDASGATEQHEYDSQGRRVRTRVNGLEVTFEYDQAGRLVASRSSSGATRRVELDDFDRVIVEADPGDIKTQFRWDAAGNLIGIVDGRGQTRSLSYTASGQLASVREPNGDEGRVIYDAAGRVSTIQRPSGGIVTVEWDAAGRLIAIADPMKLTRRYAYDPDGRRISESDPTGRSQRLTYDAAGRLLSREPATGPRTTFTYDAQHRLVAADDGALPMRWSYTAGGQIAGVEYPSLKKTLRSDYDNRGRRTRLTDFDGRSIEYAYDPAGRLAGLTMAPGTRISFSYDATSRLQSITYPNGVIGEWTYDRSGRPLSVNYRARGGQILRRVEYGYDAVGNPINKKDSLSGNWEYVYDAAGQLLEEVASSTKIGYRYGAGGNRTAKTAGTTTTDYRYDAADRLVSAGSAAFTYDGSGYPLERKDTDGVTRYELDAEGRLTSMRLASGRQFSLQYGPTGERVARSDSAVDGGRRRYFLHDGFNLVQQVDDQGRALLSFVHGPDLDRPFAVIRGAEQFFLHPDRLGSIVLITDARGTPVTSLDYDAFGNERALPVSGRPAANIDEIIAAFGFAGREREARDTGLYNFRTRHYAPALGRFLTADRLIPVDDPIQLNPYVYAKNNPLRNVDPFGLASTATENDPIVMPGVVGTGGAAPSGSLSTINQILLHNIDLLRAELADVNRLRDVFPDRVNAIKNQIDVYKGMLRDNGVRVPPNARGGVANNTLSGPGRPPISGPRTAPVRVAPVTAPNPRIPQTTVAVPAPSPSSPWQQKVDVPVMVVLTAAQVAICLSTLSAEQCFWKFAPTMVIGGVSAGARYVLTAAGHTALASFVAGVTATGSVVITSYAVYKAYGEMQRAFAALSEADRNTYFALQVLTTQTQRLKASRDNIVALDRRAEAALTDAETKRAKAVRDFAAVEAALAALGTAPAQCQEAGELQQKLITARGELEKALITVRTNVALGLKAASTCRTAADARAIEDMLDAANRAMREADTLEKDATATRQQLTALVASMGRTRRTDATAANNQLNEANEAIRQAELAERALETVASAARAPLAVYATERLALNQDYGQIEKTYLDLSGSEWFVALSDTRINLSQEFKAARSLLDELDSLATRVNSVDFEQRRAALSDDLGGLRTRSQAAGARVLGTVCEAGDGTEVMADIRRIMDSIRGQQNDLNNLAIYAAQCRQSARTSASTPSTQGSTSTQAAPPTPPSNPPQRPPATNDQRDPPGRPGAVPPIGVQFTPAPPPRLMASLGCGPILELVPGQNSKSCNIIVTGWRSDTTTPVEVLIDPLVGGVQAFPGDTSQGGDTMYAAGVSDRSNQYVFSEGFSAPRGAAASSQSIMITVRQRGNTLVQLPLTLNVIPVGAPAGITISPPAPNVQGTGGSFCVWQYKLTGDRPECWNFVGAVCTSTRYSGRPEYIQVGNNMTWGQADARIGQLSSYFNDQYGCRATITSPPTPPAPPAVVNQGSGGIYSVWRYKLVGDAPQCFHFVAAPSGKFGPPYELVGANMTQGQADARIGELSRYFDDQMGCRAANTIQPPPPPPTQPQVPVAPPVPPPPPPQPPEPPAPIGPAVRRLARFGLVPANITVNIGDLVQLRALGVFSDSPTNVVDVSTDVRWSGDKPQSFTTSAADAGRTFTITATSLDGSTTSATVTVTNVVSPNAPPPPAPTQTTDTSNRQPGGNVPSLLGGSTTRTDTGTIATGGRGTPLNTPPAPTTTTSTNTSTSASPSPTGGTVSTTTPSGGSSSPSSIRCSFGSCGYAGTWDVTGDSRSTAGVRTVPLSFENTPGLHSATLVLRAVDQAAGRAEHQRLFARVYGGGSGRCQGETDVFYSGEITFTRPVAIDGGAPLSQARVLACGSFIIDGWFGEPADPRRVSFRVSGDDKEAEGSWSGASMDLNGRVKWRKQ